jgi:DNA-binding transcriptional ArsR family regulator
MDKTKADLILHPVRLRILLELVNQPQSPRQLAQALPDVRQATLYRQINLLTQHGLLVVVEERKVHSNLEKIYGLAHQSTQLTAEDIAGFTKEEHLHYFSMYILSLIEDFARYLDSQEVVNPAADGVRYYKTPVYLSEEEFKTVEATLQAAIVPLLSHAPTPERRRHWLATVVLPALAPIKK